MATASAVSADAQDHERLDESNKKKSRLPNRRRHEEQLEELMSRIHPLEDKLKSLGRPASDATTEDNAIKDSLLSEHKRVRDEKEAAITTRKARDQDLRVLNDKISKMSDSLSKLEAGLKFKTQSAIDGAIRRLDHQLQMKHFKYSEENRIVREIDSLRRSKKKVKEYQERRKEIEEERFKKRKLKDERDKYFRLVSTLKTKEDSVKQQLTQLRSKTDEAWTRYRNSGHEREALKKEIDGLYMQRRQLIADFKQQQADYHEQAKIHRAESLRRREEEKKAYMIAKQKEWDSYEASLEPYEEEQHLCTALIKYLLKFQTTEHQDSLQEVSPAPSPVNGNPPSFWKEANKDFTILKKKTDDQDDVFLPNMLAGKKRRSGRRPRKSSWINKPLRHSAQFFSQFASLGLSAPTTPNDLTDVLDQLRAKKKQYKEFSKSAMTSDTSHHRRHLSGSSTLSTTSSQDSLSTSNVTSSSQTMSDVDSLAASVTSSSQITSEGDLLANTKQKSVLKLTTKLCALNISAAQPGSAKKNDLVSGSSELSNELALPTHRLETDGIGDGSSSSATESTLPETPLSDMSAPFETSWEGLDSGIDENRGSKLEEGNLYLVVDDDDLCSAKHGIISNDLSAVEKTGDLNANNEVVQGSINEEGVNNSHNAKQDQLRCRIGGDMADDINGIRISQESESFHDRVNDGIQQIDQDRVSQKVVL